MAERHDEQLLGFATLDKLFPIIDTVDSLDSDVKTRPLSARQGKVLKQMIEAIKTLQLKVVTALPVVGEDKIIYLLLNSESTEDTNKYDEYVWVSSLNKYEKLGSFSTSVDIDLSNYTTIEQLNQALQGKQDKLVSGTNIKTINSQSLLGNGNIDIDINNIYFPPYFTELTEELWEEYYDNVVIKGKYIVSGNSAALLSAYIEEEGNFYIILTDANMNNEYEYSKDKDVYNYFYGSIILSKTREDSNSEYTYSIEYPKDRLFEFHRNGNSGKIRVYRRRKEPDTYFDLEMGDKLPTEGTPNQVLTKTEDSYEWKDPQAAFPGGGTVGQVLKKTATGVEWGNDNDTTYQNASQSKAGLMSAEDKTKLDSLTGTSVTILTQAEYDALDPKENNRIYYIKG